MFFVVGLTAFGAAVLQSLRSVPVKRGWLRREDIDEGLGLVQLYPGAMMVDLVAYVGYRTRRIRGALAATVGFVTPSVLLVLGLSWAYVEHGTGGGARDLVVGLDAIVVGVVTSVAWGFGRTGRGIPDAPSGDARINRGRIRADAEPGIFDLGFKISAVAVLWALFQRRPRADRLDL